MDASLSTSQGTKDKAVFKSKAFPGDTAFNKDACVLMSDKSHHNIVMSQNTKDMAVHESLYLI